MASMGTPGEGDGGGLGAAPSGRTKVVVALAGAVRAGGHGQSCPRAALDPVRAEVWPSLPRG